MVRCGFILMMNWRPLCQGGASTGQVTVCMVLGSACWRCIAGTLGFVQGAGLESQLSASVRAQTALGIRTTKIMKQIKVVYKLLTAFSTIH